MLFIQALVPLVMASLYAMARRNAELASALIVHREYPFLQSSIPADLVAHGLPCGTQAGI